MDRPNAVFDHRSSLLLVVIYAVASGATGSPRRTLTLTSTRDPSRLMIDMRRSTVNRPKSALRMREKSAAAIPVRLCAARTLRPSRSSALMISGARMALNCWASVSHARGREKHFRCPALLLAFRSSSQHLLQSLQTGLDQIDIALWCVNAAFCFQTLAGHVATAFEPLPSTALL
jgi:hypothetical protein